MNKAPLLIAGFSDDNIYVIHAELSTEELLRISVAVLMLVLQKGITLENVATETECFHIASSEQINAPFIVHGGSE